MPASSGCELWTQQFEQLRYKVPGIQLGSASPDGAPSGKQWLLDFEKQCPQNHADFITLHWYDVTYEAAELVDGPGLKRTETRRELDQLPVPQ